MLLFLNIRTKKILVSLLLSLFSQLLCNNRIVAQVSGNGRKLPVTVIEMKNGNSVRGIFISENKEQIVVRTERRDTLTILKSAIDEIREVDGPFVESLPPGSQEAVYDLAKQERDSYHTAYFSNLIAYNIADLLFQNVSASYERIISDGYFGVKIPVSIGIGKDGSEPTIVQRKIGSIGLALNYYAGGQGKARCFFGPGFETGKYRHQVSGADNSSNSSGTSIDIFYSSICLNTGFMVQISKTITLGWQFGIGARWDRETDFYNYTIPAQHQHSMWNLGMDFAYRF